jgi:hypothetical protein
MSASSNWHYRSIVAGAQRRSVSGRSGRSRRALAMHKNTTSPLSARPWSGLPNRMKNS